MVFRALAPRPSGSDGGADDVGARHRASAAIRRRSRRHARLAAVANRRAEQFGALDSLQFNQLAAESRGGPLYDRCARARHLG